MGESRWSGCSPFICMFCFPALRPPPAARAQQPSLTERISTHLAAVDSKVVRWRRDIHQHPELSFQEARTAQLVATHLRNLGLEVRTAVGGHGVIGVLRRGRPGPVVAPPADLDALP